MEIDDTDLLIVGSNWGAAAAVQALLVAGQRPVWFRGPKGSGGPQDTSGSSTERLINRFMPDNPTGLGETNHLNARWHGTTNRRQLD